MENFLAAVEKINGIVIANKFYLTFFYKLVKLLLKILTNAV